MNVPYPESSMFVDRVPTQTNMPNSATASGMFIDNTGTKVSTPNNFSYMQELGNFIYTVIHTTLNIEMASRFTVSVHTVRDNGGWVDACVINVTKIPLEVNSPTDTMTYTIVIPPETSTPDDTTRYNPLGYKASTELQVWLKMVAS